MIQRKTASQFIKFAIVGVLSTLVNYAIFYILHMFFSLDYIFASAIGYIIGVITGFMINKAWTFSNHSESGKYLFKYFAIYVFSLIVSLAFLKIAVEEYKMLAIVANMLSIVVTTAINFMGTKLLVFKA